MNAIMIQTLKQQKKMLIKTQNPKKNQIKNN